MLCASRSDGGARPVEEAPGWLSPGWTRAHAARSSRRPPRRRAVPTHARRRAKDIIAQLGEKAWRRISWRNGTKGPLQAEFIAVRVRVADGPEGNDRIHLPGDEAWLVAERRHTGEV